MIKKLFTISEDTAELLSNVKNQSALVNILLTNHFFGQSGIEQSYVPFSRFQKVNYEKNLYKKKVNNLLDLQRNLEIERTRREEHERRILLLEEELANSTNTNSANFTPKQAKKINFEARFNSKYEAMGGIKKIKELINKKETLNNIADQFGFSRAYAGKVVEMLIDEKYENYLIRHGLTPFGPSKR